MVAPDGCALSHDEAAAASTAKPAAVVVAVVMTWVTRRGELKSARARAEQRRR